MKFVTVTLCALLLAGCGGGVTEQAGTEKYNNTHADVPRGDLYGQKVNLPSGQTVECVVYDGVRAGGLSCDWTNAK